MAKAKKKESKAKRRPRVRTKAERDAAAVVANKVRLAAMTEELKTARGGRFEDLRSTSAAILQEESDRLARLAKEAQRVENREELSFENLKRVQEMETELANSETSELRKADLARTLDAILD